jgi:RNase H-fold protein (predicted Holliday junction resolvase)
MEVQDSIRDHFDNLYSNKFENLEEMERFLDTYNHPNLKQEDINHLNRSITQNKFEAAIKSFPKKKSPEPDRFCAEFYQTFKELISTLLKLFHEIYLRDPKNSTQNLLDTINRYNNIVEYKINIENH